MQYPFRYIALSRVRNGAYCNERQAHLRRHLSPSDTPDPTPPRAPSSAPAGAAGQQDEAPLAGVKVVDLTTIFSGPICASILGDHGVPRPAPPSLVAPAHTVTTTPPAPSRLTH